MSEMPVLVAQVRDEFGKGAARRARRGGMVPGVLYGAGHETTHIDLPGHELFLAVRDHRNEEVQVNLDGASYTVRFQEVQRHPVSRALLHVDLLVVEAK